MFSPPCRWSMRILTVPSLILVLKVQSWLLSRVPETIRLGCRMKVLNSVYLCVARLICWFVCSMAWVVRLIRRLFRLISGPGPLSQCCVMVVSCVDSLVRLKGPARQLLVFVPSFLTWLETRLSVARTTIGAMLLCWCSACRKVTLCLLGSTRLSRIRLQVVVLRRLVVWLSWFI